MSSEEEPEKVKVVDEEPTVSEELQISNVVSSNSMAVLPVESNTTSSASVQQPRQPTSLQDLLRYCVEAKGSSDASDHEVPGPISLEVN